MDRLYLTDRKNLTGYCQALAEVDGASGDTLRNYVYGPDYAPLAQSTAAGAPDFFHADHLGTTRALTTSAGSASPVQQYEPYGTPSNGALSSLTSKYFTAQDRDVYTNLQYHRARWLDTTQGRWYSQDPVFDFPANFGNAFLYAGANPLNSLDVSGSFSLVEIGIGCAIIAISGTIGYIKIVIPRQLRQQVALTYPPGLDYGGNNSITNQIDKCGPNVTPQMHKLMDALGNWWGTLTTEEQERVVSTLDPFDAIVIGGGHYVTMKASLNGWDIQPLRRYATGGDDNSEEWGEDTKVWAALRGSGKCWGTVMYENECVWAGDLNYMLYGRIMALGGESYFNHTQDIEWSKSFHGDRPEYAKYFYFAGYYWNDKNVYYFRDNDPDNRVAQRPGFKYCKPCKQTVKASFEANIRVPSSSLLWLFWQHDAKDYKIEQNQ